jgi:hypothetical protein
MKYLIRCVLLTCLSILWIGVWLHDGSFVRYAQYLDSISRDRTVVSSWRDIPDLLWWTQFAAPNVLDTGSTSLSDLLQDQQDLLWDQAVELFETNTDATGQMMSGQYISWVTQTITSSWVSSSGVSTSSGILVDDPRVSVVVVSGSSASTGTVRIQTPTTSSVLIQ